MNKTSPWMLVGTAVFCAAAGAILAWGFYGRFPSIPLSASLTLGALALICAILGYVVRSRVNDGGIGQDRSQLNPVTASQFLIMGKAAEWTGSILGGGYVGLAFYVVPASRWLLAAAEDLTPVLLAAGAGILLALAGAYLENSCHLPPPTDGEPVG
ncbi:DUF3180 domain-containing protein [Corynebacterium uropygiale]|uniref:DUF3180 domain-containing protein n=1 Tax=Corynebacterium uropygiale TaxID=1775911 RepID=A0A9X1TYE3_9CORY|nr:DUF3180 domain-containing protein [Corynebacterium uropygiale]MCF4007205.1 DUF3180 domain-containing protein [Corynebacterium uropygiale]